MKPNNIQNTHKEGYYLNPLFVTLLIIGLCIAMASYYGKELDKLDKQIQQLTETHNTLEELLRKKHSAAVDYYEGLIAIQRDTINKLYKEKEYMNDKVLLPLGEFEATAYDLSIQSCGKPKSSRGYGITANGTSIAGHSRESAMTIAVDPNIIPLGTKVYIEFPEQFKYLNGIYTANDTGSAIKGKIIDVFMGDFQQDTTSETVWEFGRRKVKVYKVLNEKNK